MSKPQNMPDFSLDNLELLFSQSGFYQMSLPEAGRQVSELLSVLFSVLVSAGIARAFSICCRYIFGLVSAFVSWMLRLHIFSHICWFEYELAFRLSLAILA